MVGHAALRGHGAGEVPVSLAAEGGLQPHEFTHMPGVHNRVQAIAAKARLSLTRDVQRSEISKITVK